MADREFLGGVTNTTLHFEDGKIIIEEKVDAEPILEYATAARKQRYSADVCDGMLRHEAEIPWPIFQKECLKRGIDAAMSMHILDTELGDAIIDAIINDPQYAYLRTTNASTDARIRMKGAR